MPSIALAIFIITILFSSCVSKHQAPDIPNSLTTHHYLNQDPANALWHTCRFTLLWPEGRETDKALPALN